MNNINSEMKKIMQNLQDNIKNKEDLEIAKVEFFNLYNLFFEEIIKMEELVNSRIAEMARIQTETNEKIDNLEKSLKKIEKDIYMDEEFEDGEYDIEITCPYCNKEFSVEIDEVADKDEIHCPECNNSIELDWGEGCGCGDDCDCCSDEGCSHKHDEEDDM